MSAIKVGISLAEYEYMTPAELNMHIQVFNERMRREGNEGVTLAYLTAAWGRAKRMPPLEKMLQKEPRKPQTEDQMLEIVKKLNALAGGSVH